MESVRSKIVIVDDNKANLTIGRNVLKIFYEVYPAPSADKLFEILDNNVLPDLILLDIEMPEMNGYEAIKILKADSRFIDIPVIFVTSRSDESSELEGLELGAVDYISKPFSAPLLLKRIANQLLIARQKRELLVHQTNLERHMADLEKETLDKNDQVIALQNTLLATVANLVECRDKLTGGHIVRTQLYMKALLEELIRRKIYQEEIASWDMSFFLPSVPLHDVGKIAITDLILNKPGALTKEEFEIMKTHVTVGVDALEKIIHNMAEHAFLRHTLYIAGTHHEKWDGTGYPTGLRGRDIPLEGRLMAIADVYDALISARPYKEAIPHEKASKIIEEGAGTHFDPTLVDVFIGVESEFAHIVKEIGTSTTLLEPPRLC